MLKLFAINFVVRWREWHTGRALQETPCASARRLLLSKAEPAIGRLPSSDPVYR